MTGGYKTMYPALWKRELRRIEVRSDKKKERVVKPPKDDETVERPVPVARLPQLAFMDKSRWFAWEPK